MISRISKLFLLFCLPSLLSGHILMARQHGELCDWRSPTETCDELKGLACSYKSQRCTCWDIRTIYSHEKGRCVGKAGEECHLFGGERLCTENAYCLEDETLSSIPICLCLKGYFKGGNGECIRRSKFGEFCDLPSKHSNTATMSTSSNSNCEPEAGLQCINYSCQCEGNQIYDSKRELCISLAGMSCSKTLNNCVENSECVEKVYALDYASGRTKMIGHRCSCMPGFKVTKDRLCGVEYGGECTTSAQCLSSENLTCINSQCQCNPLSEVYDRRVRRCLTLVGGRCKAPQKKEDRISYIHEPQQDIDKTGMDSIGKPQTLFSLPSTTTITTTTSTTTTKTTSSTTPPTPTTTSPSKTTTSTATTGPNGTTPIPISIISSRNLSSRDFKFLRHPHNRQFSQSTPGLHFLPPARHYIESFREMRQDYQYPDVFPEHRTISSSNSNSPSPAIIMECVPNAECTQSSSSSTDYFCACKKGSTETGMRTCLLDFGELCGSGRGMTSSPLECNVFAGLVCKNNRCECADPMLTYDNDTRSCLSSVGNPCGKMKVNSKLINSLTYLGVDKVNVDNTSEDLSSIPPFHVYQAEPIIYINCVPDAICVEKKSGNGQLKQICTPKSKFQSNGFGVGFAS